jgi:hypothetical protein
MKKINVMIAVNRPTSDKYLQRVTVSVSDIGQSLATRFYLWPAAFSSRSLLTFKSKNRILLGKSANSSDPRFVSPLRFRL